jgi:hypothetical protein
MTEWFLRASGYSQTFRIHAVTRLWDEIGYSCCRPIIADWGGKWTF